MKAFWCLGAAFLLAVALGTASTQENFVSFLFLVSALLVLGVRFLPLRLLRLLFGSVIVFLVGYWYGHTVLSSYESLPLESQTDTTLRVSDFGEDRGWYQAVVLESLCQDNCLPVRVLWQAPIYVEVLPGQRYTIQCQLVRPENFSEDFNYQRYLAKERIGYICKKAESFTREEDDWWARSLALLYTPRVWLETGIRELYPEPLAGLATGLLIGGNHRLSEKVNATFQQVGLSHIVAVSGYNIVLIVGAFLWFFLTIGFWRKQALFGALIGTALFVFLIGAPASAVRAALMALAAALGLFLGRPAFSFRALFLAAVLMVALNPLVLLYDAGFQLSCLATLGVLLAIRIADGRFSSVLFVRFWQETIWISFFVYIFLLPILVYQFGYLTPWSVIANSILLPLVPLAMLSSFLGALFGALLSPLGVFVAMPGYVALAGIVYGAEWFSQRPLVTVPFQVPLVLVLCWYGAIFAGLTFYERKRHAQKNYHQLHCPHSH